MQFYISMQWHRYCKIYSRITVVLTLYRIRTCPPLWLPSFSLSRYRALSILAQNGLCQKCLAKNIRGQTRGTPAQSIIYSWLKYMNSSQKQSKFAEYEGISNINKANIFWRVILKFEKDLKDTSLVYFSFNFMEIGCVLVSFLPIWNDLVVANPPRLKRSKCMRKYNHNKM